MTAVGATPCGAVIVENVRDLQNWPGHGGQTAAFPGTGSRSSRLSTAVIRPVATRAYIALSFRAFLPAPPRVSLPPSDLVFGG